MYDIPINWLAVVVAAVLSFVIGGLWYSPLLFAKAWVRAHGYTDEQVQRMRANAPKAYAISFLCMLVMAAILAFLLGLTPIIRWQGGAKLGLLCWAGFAATIGLTQQVYSEKKPATFLIDAGYQLVYLVLMGALLAWWR